MQAAKAQREAIVATVQTNGKIEPINNFEAHAPAPTTVKRLFVHEGQHVQPGQMLVELDDSDARARAAQALAAIRTADANLHAVRQGGTREEIIATQADLAKARTERDAAQRNLDAMHRLQQSGAASAGEVADAENRLKTAQAQLTMLQERLNSRYAQPDVAKVQAQSEEARAAYAAAEDTVSRANVRAPREGVVYSLPVHEGQFVNGGDLLVQVADISKVQLRAFVDEPDIGKLRDGQLVRVTWDALPGRTWEGTVTQVPSTVVTLGSRNVGQFTCVVNNPDEKLLPNVNVNVNIVVAQHDNVLTVPREAIHEDGGKRFVFQIVDGELRRTPVATSVANLTRMEVTDGLSDNALVALNATNGQPLRAGMSVRVAQD